MGIFVFGVNHKSCPIEIREKIHFSSAQIGASLSRAMTCRSFSEFLVLSTCNRVELYGFTPLSGLPEEELLRFLELTHGVKRGEFLSYLYRYEGKEAVRHFFKVAAGLDSLVVGENEILGQLREAFRAAVSAGSVHSVLYRLSEKALRVGKKVRNETRINEGAVSIPSVAAELAEKIFGKLAGEKVMILGAGDMSALTLTHLKNIGARALYIVSRNQARGSLLASEFGAEWVSFEQWASCLASVDILVASTACPHYLVHYDQVKHAMEKRRFRPLFLIDTAVPRNIAPEVGRIDDAHLYNIDDLKSVADANLKKRVSEVRAAEKIIDEAVSDYTGWFERLKARPTLERFESYLNGIIDKELGNLEAAVSIGEDERGRIRDRIRTRLLHPAHERLKEASRNGGVARYLELLDSLFDLKGDG